MHRFALVFLALAGVACGGGSQTSTTSTGSSSSGASSSTSTGTSSSTASSGGTGGAGGHGTGTGGAGGSGPCVGSIDIAVDSKVLQHWTFECNGDFDASTSTTPVGYFYAGNLPGEPHGLRIVGCASSAANSEGVVLSALGASTTGTYNMGTPQYTDANGVVTGSATDTFSMVVSALGGAGEPIDGTFTATSSNPAVAHSLTGSFHVCHGNDFLPP